MADPSIRDIAAAVLTTKTTTPPPAEPTREQAAGDEREEEHLDTGAQQEEADGQPPLADDNDEPDAGDDDTSGQGDDGEDGEPVYRVKVDGKTLDVPLSELIASYSGEGAIAKRLQEATEARNEAVRARDVAVEQERTAARETIQRETETLRLQANQLAQVYSTYADAILKPEVAMPDPKLQVTDPIGYLTAVEAYRQDQDRLRQQAAHMHEVVQEANRLEVEHRAEFARAEVQKMMQEVPAMGNPEYRKAQAARVIEAGKAVGFSEEEIRAGATDRRFIYLGMLAAQAIEVMMKTRDKGKPTVKPKAPPPKPVAVVERTRNGRFTSSNKEAVAKARETGDYRDVAKTLIVRRPAARAS